MGALIRALAASVALLVAATGAARPSAIDGARFYRLRVVTADGKRTKLLFSSPIDPNGNTRWVFVDLSPQRTRALMTEVVPTADHRGPESLYLADVRGGLQRLLTTTTAFMPWGRWSPDGARFFFETFNDAACGEFTFWSAAEDGGAVHRLGSGQLFAWGPKGSYAIERGCSGAGVLPAGPLVFTDRSAREHVITNRWAAAMVVSPRGDRIAYETYRTVPSGTVPTLHIARTDGTGEIAAIHKASSAAWSPDGRRLAFVRGAWSGSIAVAGAGGRGIRTVARGSALRIPAWSPDGRRIAYARGFGGLYTVRPDETGTRRVARAHVLHLWWSLDSRRIYYDG